MELDTALRQISDMERQLGGSLAYMRDLATHNLSGFNKFMRFMPLSRHRSAAGIDQVAIAGLIGSREQDCGPCLQIAADMYINQGADPKVVQAVLDENPDGLDDPRLRTVYDYAQAVARDTADVTGQISRVRDQLGEPVLTDLALTIASLGMFPIVKRGLGYKTSHAEFRTQIRLPKEEHAV